MNIVAILCVGAFVAFVTYKIGQGSSVGKMSKYNNLPFNLTFKVLYSDKIRTVLESIEAVPKTYTISSWNLHEKIRPGDTVRNVRSNKEQKENGIKIQRTKWGTVIDFPTIIKVSVGV